MMMCTPLIFVFVSSIDLSLLAGVVLVDELLQVELQSQMLDIGCDLKVASGLW